MGLSHSNSFCKTMGCSHSNSCENPTPQSPCPSPTKDQCQKFLSSELQVPELQQKVDDLQNQLKKIHGPCPDNMPYLGSWSNELFCYDLARSNVCSYKKGDVSPPIKGYTWGQDQPACYP